MLAALLVAVAGCGTLTVSQERELGSEFAEMARREFRFLRDPVVERYIDEMGQSLVLAAGPQPFTYHFSVIVDEELNAFAAPGGHIFIQTGTILAARNVSELAGVVAHEVAHVVHRHVAENYSRARNTSIGRDILVLGAAVVGGGAVGNVASLGTAVAATAYLNKFSREDEAEADRFAVMVMPRAGYDPDGLVHFFEMIQREEGAGGRSFLSSHPATADRIEAARAEIDGLPEGGGAKLHDGGRFEIIQRRIELLTGVRR